MPIFTFCPQLMAGLKIANCVVLLTVRYYKQFAAGGSEPLKVSQVPEQVVAVTLRHPHAVRVLFGLRKITVSNFPVAP